MKNKNVRYAIIAGVVACIVLISAISVKVICKPQPDNIETESGVISVNPDETHKYIIPNDIQIKNEKNEEPPEEEKKAAEPDSKVQDDRTDTSTVQELIETPTKPEPPQAPKPKETSDLEDKNNVPEYKPEDVEIATPENPKGGDEKDGKVYVPGFGWVDKAEPAKTETNQDMYQNGNKIGDM